MNSNMVKEEFPVIRLDQLGIDGLIYVIEKKHLIWRALWACLIVSLGAFGAYLCYNTSIEFVQNPKATLIGLQEVDKLEFPKIAVCSSSPDAISPDRISADFFNSSLGQNE